MLLSINKAELYAFLLDFTAEQSHLRYAAAFSPIMLQHVQVISFVIRCEAKFSKVRLEIFKCTWVKCLLETNLAPSVKPSTDDGFRSKFNLVPRASFPLTSGRKTRALGASNSGMRHRCHRCRLRTAQWNRMCRIRLFPLLFQNGCSQSSRFRTAGQGERSSGNEIAQSSSNNCKNYLLKIYTQHINVLTTFWNFSL